LLGRFGAGGERRRGKGARCFIFWGRLGNRVTENRRHSGRFSSRNGQCSACSENGKGRQAASGKQKISANPRRLVTALAIPLLLGAGKSTALEKPLAICRYLGWRGGMKAGVFGGNEPSDLQCCGGSGAWGQGREGGALILPRWEEAFPGGRGSRQKE